jgi:hypothetical protein
MKLSHFPEPRQAHGGLAGEGALNLLGRPDLDPLVVLVREAGQNSWDARLSEHGPVEFNVSLSRVDETRRAVLRKEVFTELPPRGIVSQDDGPEDEVARRDLPEALADADLWMLTITDRNTTGLGGPIRADLPPMDDKDTPDFVDFVFNIGQPSDKELGGGTYGFGKTISYLVSRCRTVVIHTRTVGRNGPEQRLIAQAIGHQYTQRGRNYTGRHWWGRVDRHGRVLPLIGNDAEVLARRLNLPSLDSDTGTTIAIIDPAFAQRTAEEAASFIAEAIPWSFWPKMVAERGRAASMAFSVSLNGVEVLVPDPRRTPPLDAYVRALRALRECEAGRGDPAELEPIKVTELRSQRPAAILGLLAMTPNAAQRMSRQGDPGASEDPEHDPTATARPFLGRSHHVALMRQAELVVRYLPGPELPDRSIEYAGVFKADASVDGAFAESEPPTHDDWRPVLVSASWNRRYVNIALRQLRNALARIFDGAAAPAERDEPVSTVVVADALGHLLAPVEGTGASKRAPTSPRGTARPRAARVEIVGQHLESVEEATLLLVDFRIVAAPGTDGTLVDATAGIATADAASVESEPPADAAVPRVLGFRIDGELQPGDAIFVPSNRGDDISVVVEPVPGTATVVDVTPVREAVR